jgi:hypothetical protein
MQDADKANLPNDIYMQATMSKHKPESCTVSQKLQKPHRNRVGR